MAINEKLLIPDTAIEPSFNTVIYTGNSSTNSITGVGFKPDLVWIKNRTKLGGHWLTDSVRGVSKGIMTQSTSAEITTLPELMSSFNSDGFTVGYISNDTTNISTSDYVAWCFKAGGAPTTTNIGGQTPTSGSKIVDGTAKTDNYPTSDIYPTKQSVNTKLGFSATEFIGEGSGKYLPHGLDVPPEMYIIKTTSTTDNWWVYIVFGGDFEYLRLNGTHTGIDADQYYDRPTANLIEQGQLLNSTNIMYAFASKTGVSKVGTYTGTGTSGNVITTGFEPAFVMIKNIDDTGSWLMLDNVRDTDGVLNEHLYANLSNAEATASTATITPTINGFTIGNSNSIHLNRSGDDFIYYAIADI